VTTAQPAEGGLEVPGSQPLDWVAFDRAAGSDDQSRGLDPVVEELVADRVEEAAGRSGRLLEVGVGTGRIALPLHRRGRRVVGVELSPPMLARYRAKAAEARRVLVAGGLLLSGGGGGGERGGGNPHDQVGSRFDELAGGQGTPRLVGASHRQVLDRLRAMGGRVEELEPVVWEDQETYAEALRRIEERIFSYHWRLPDEVWRAAAAQVRAEFEAAHPADLDTPRPARHTFQFMATRF
jgi:SAM-dependent methyltransferase